MAFCKLIVPKTIQIRTYRVRIGFPRSFSMKFESPSYCPAEILSECYQHWSHDHHPNVRLPSRCIIIEHSIIRATCSRGHGMFCCILISTYSLRASIIPSQVPFSLARNPELILENNNLIHYGENTNRACVYANEQNCRISDATL